MLHTTVEGKFSKCQNKCAKEDLPVQDVFWTSYVRSIYVLRLRGKHSIFEMIVTLDG